MTGLWAAPGQGDQGLPPPDLPRYPTSTGYQTPIVWGVEPRPVTRRQLVARWLASQAATPVVKVVAVGSAVGWVAAAAALAWISASGHVLSLVTGAQPVADMAVGLIDFGTVMLAPRFRSQSDRPSRAARKALRKARVPAGRTPGTRAFVRRSLRFLSLPSATASLPRSLRILLDGAIWTSVLAATWQLAAGAADLVGPGDPSAQGQQFAASIWMLHLIAWCTIACIRLSRSRR